MLLLVPLCIKAPGHTRRHFRIDSRYLLHTLLCPAVGLNLQTIVRTPSTQILRVYVRAKHAWFKYKADTGY